MTELHRQIEKKREELSTLYAENGLNDLIIRKSQELGQLIIKAQKYKLEQMVSDKEQDYITRTSFEHGS